MSGPEPNHLIGMVEQMFNLEQRPVMPKLISIPAGDTAIERSMTGLCLAINTVIEADYTEHLQEWDERRNRLLDWHEHLRAHPIPDTAEAVGAIDRGEMSITEAILGTDHWSEMMDDLAAMARWSATRHQESARKLGVIVDAEKRATEIRHRGDARVQQILKSSNRKLKKLAEEDVTRRDEIIAAGRREVEAVSEVAVKRTNLLIRQVLDLDENIAVTTTVEWLRKHGLDS